jgi:hypothetical protein
VDDHAGLGQGEPVNTPTAYSGIYPGKRYRDWKMDDRAGKDGATVRRITDDIEGRVRELIREEVVPA